MEQESHHLDLDLQHCMASKYRKVVFENEVDEVLKVTCLEIEKRYEIKLIEIGTDKDHVQFLIQSIPMYSV